MKYLKTLLWVSIAFQAFVWLVFIPLSMIHEKNLAELSTTDATVTDIHAERLGGRNKKWHLVGDLVFDSDEKHCVVKNYNLGPLSQEPSPETSVVDREVKLGVTSHSCGGFVLYPFEPNKLSYFVKISAIGNLLIFVFLPILYLASRFDNRWRNRLTT